MRTKGIASDTGFAYKGSTSRERLDPALIERELTIIRDDLHCTAVDAAFVYLFALYHLPHRPDGDPRHDLDLASIGIVKVLNGANGTTYPDMPWEPKAAFTAIADRYAS